MVRGPFRGAQNTTRSARGLAAAEFIKRSTDRNFDWFTTIDGSSHEAMPRWVVRFLSSGCFPEHEKQPLPVGGHTRHVKIPRCGNKQFGFGASQFLTKD